MERKGVCREGPRQGGREAGRERASTHSHTLRRNTRPRNGRKRERKKKKKTNMNTLIPFQKKGPLFTLNENRRRTLPPARPPSLPPALLSFCPLHPAGPGTASCRSRPAAPGRSYRRGPARGTVFAVALPRPLLLWRQGFTLAGFAYHPLLSFLS